MSEVYSRTLGATSPTEEGEKKAFKTTVRSRTDFGESNKDMHTNAWRLVTRPQF